MSTEMYKEDERKDAFKKILGLASNVFFFQLVLIS